MEIFRLNEFIIHGLDWGTSVHYEVFTEGGYFCRLKPEGMAFELSPLDRAIGNFPDPNLIRFISDSISDYFE